MLVTAQSFREPLDFDMVFVESSVCHTLEARTLAMSLVTDDFEDPVSYSLRSEKIHKPHMERSFIVRKAPSKLDMTSPNIGETMKPTRFLEVNPVRDYVAGSHLAESLHPFSGTLESDVDVCHKTIIRNIHLFRSLLTFLIFRDLLERVDPLSSGISLGSEMSLKKLGIVSLKKLDCFNEL